MQQNISQREGHINTLQTNKNRHFITWSLWKEILQKLFLRKIILDGSMEVQKWVNSTYGEGNYIGYRKLFFFLLRLDIKLFCIQIHRFFLLLKSAVEPLIWIFPFSYCTFQIQNFYLFLFYKCHIIIDIIILLLFCFSIFF